MKMSRKNKGTTKLPMKKGTRRSLVLYAILVLLFTFGSVSAYATDPIGAVSNFSDFIFGLIKAIGLILLAFGVVQVGLSLKSHDPSQRANGFLTLAGGIVIFFTKEILSIITGG